MKSFLVKLLSRVPWMLKACESFVRPVKVCICRLNYARVLKRIRGGKNPIRVLFKVTESAKWKCQTVFERMRESSDFDPLIVLVPNLPKSANSDEDLETKFRNLENYFDQLGDEHVRGMSTSPMRLRDLRDWNPDVVFLPDPWTAQGLHSAYALSKFSLVCYVPYYLIDFVRTKIECQLPMHRYLHSFFVLNQATADRYRSSMNSLMRVPRYVATGHPALDNLRSVEGADQDGWVIYAPHWSVLHPNPNSRIATFEWSGKAILDYAKQHPQIKWLFKPHPSLRKQLIETGIMSVKEVDEYYAEWESIADSCYHGSYQPIFMASRLLITDCGSFITEYPTTQKPLIHLRNRTSADIPSLPNIWNSFYVAFDQDEMLRVFKEVIENGEDPKREERIAAVKEAGLGGVNAARNIVDYLRNVCRG